MIRRGCFGCVKGPRPPRSCPNRSRAIAAPETIDSFRPVGQLRHNQNLVSRGHGSSGQRPKPCQARNCLLTFFLSANHRKDLSPFCLVPTVLKMVLKGHQKESLAFLGGALTKSHTLGSSASHLLSWPQTRNQTFCQPLKWSNPQKLRKSRNSGSEDVCLSQKNPQRVCCSFFFRTPDHGSIIFLRKIDLNEVSWPSRSPTPGGSGARSPGETPGERSPGPGRASGSHSCRGGFKPFGLKQLSAVRAKPGGKRSGGSPKKPSRCCAVLISLPRSG